MYAHMCIHACLHLITLRSSAVAYDEEKEHQTAQNEKQKELLRIEEAKKQEETKSKTLIVQLHFLFHRSLERYHVTI